MAPPSSTLVNKLKVQLKLSISRLRMVQQKDSAKAKQQRREMAQLLEAGKIQSARIRVENIIRSDITTELHEMLELYCELVLARSQLLEPSPSYTTPSSKDPSPPLDPALEEAVRSLIHAAPRTEIKELHTTRALLVEKFGKEVALASMEGSGVADRVLKKLTLETPKPELVDAYLSEIARFYGVPYGDSGMGDDDEEGGQGIQEEEEITALEREVEEEEDAEKEEEVEELVKAVPSKKLGPQSPLRITPPSPSTDNVAPKLKLPGAGAARTGGGASSTAAAKKNAQSASKGPASDKLGKIPDVDELARRFAELKK